MQPLCGFLLSLGIVLIVVVVDDHVDVDDADETVLVLVMGGWIWLNR